MGFLCSLSLVKPELKSNKNENVEHLTNMEYDNGINNNKAAIGLIIVFCCVKNVLLMCLD